MGKVGEYQNCDAADDGHPDLPDGWYRTRLGDIGTLTTGNTPSRLNSSYFGNAYPWVKPSDLDQARPITTTTEGLSEDGGSVARLLPPGTVMLSCIGNLGKVAIAGATLATNQQINSITFDDIVHPRYGLHYCRTLRGWLEDQASATTIPIVNKGRLSTAPFLLAPYAEQLRIAKKIDTLLEQLDQLRTRLSRVPAILKRFRQAVLAAACSGKLTEEWRHCKNLEPGSALLARILRDRERLVKEQKGMRRQYIQQEVADVDALPCLPECWTWASVDSISTRVVDGVHKTPVYVDHGIPFVTVRNLTAGSEISFESLNHITPEDHEKFVERANPEKGDILVSKDGTLGIVRAIRTDRTFSIFVSVALIKLVTKKMTDYMEMALSAPQVQEQMIGTGSGLQHIHLRDLRADCVPLPPLEEQREIVRRVKALFVLADGIERRVANANVRTDKLSQSILAKAFRGELVPTEAELARREGREYEPASVLLERIKRERETASNHKGAIRRAAKRKKAHA